MLAADGLEHFVFAGREKASYSLGYADPITGTYAVHGDGSMSLMVHGTDPIVGALSEDRTFFVAGGGPSQPGPSYFFFGLKQ